MHLVIQFEKVLDRITNGKKVKVPKKNLKKFGKKMTYKVTNGIEVDRCYLEIKSLSICIVYVISNNHYITSYIISDMTILYHIEDIKRMVRHHKSLESLLPLLATPVNPRFKPSGY